jgi:flagellar FliJ protein
VADLSPLIRLKKHEVDQQRHVLAKLYQSLGLLEQERARIEAELAAEKDRLNHSDEVAFTFAGYLEGAMRKINSVDQLRAQLNRQIEEEKDVLIDLFAELKKYEMTQEERERLEEEERQIKENQMLDAIGLETFRRRDDA